MRKLTFLFIALVLIPGITGAQKADAGRLDWWRDAKFGMFIHWGVYSLYGGVYQGHRQARGDAALDPESL